MRSLYVAAVEQTSAGRAGYADRCTTGLTDRRSESETERRSLSPSVTTASVFPDAVTNSTSNLSLKNALIPVVTRIGLQLKDQDAQEKQGGDDQQQTPDDIRSHWNTLCNG